MSFSKKHRYLRSDQFIVKWIHKLEYADKYSIGVMFLFGDDCVRRKHTLNVSEIHVAKVYFFA